MPSLEEIIERLKSLTVEEQEADLLKIVERHSSEAIDLNTSQLMKGINSKGESLGEYRSKKYAEFKRFLNPAGVMDLKFEGDFHGGFFIETERFPVTFNSRDDKTFKLVRYFGEYIFGLTKENKNKLVEEYYKEDIQEYYKGILQL